MMTVGRGRCRRRARLKPDRALTGPGGGEEQDPGRGQLRAWLLLLLLGRNEAAGLRRRVSARHDARRRAVSGQGLGQRCHLPAAGPQERSADRLLSAARGLRKACPGQAGLLEELTGGACCSGSGRRSACSTRTCACDVVFLPLGPVRVDASIRKPAHPCYLPAFCSPCSDPSLATGRIVVTRQTTATGYCKVALSPSGARV